MIDSKTSRIFRGIAILLVIASHYAGWMYVEPVRPELKEFVSTLGVYGVDIFFLLSGYGLVKSASRNGINWIFVLKRFVNSYLPYFLIVGFWAITEKSLDSWSAWRDLLIGYDYWYMCVLFAMYIMFMLIYRIGKYKEVLITIAVIGFTYWLYYRGQADFWELSNGAFLIGIYMASLEDKLNEYKNKWGWKILLTLIGLGATIGGYYLHKGNGEMWSHMVTSMSFTVLVLGLCLLMKPFGVVLPSLGRYSLYIYLLHTRLFWKFVMYNEEWTYAKSAVFAAVLTLFIGISIGFAIDWNLNRITNRIIGRRGSVEKS